MLIVPVLTQDEKNQNSVDNCPRAIILLINKRLDGQADKAIKFSKDDVEQLESLALSIGRCHENISKIEQLHSMTDVSRGLVDINRQLGSTVEESVQSYRTI